MGQLMYFRLQTNQWSDVKNVFFKEASLQEQEQAPGREMRAGPTSPFGPWWSPGSYFPFLDVHRSTTHANEPQSNRAWIVSFKTIYTLDGGSFPLPILCAHPTHSEHITDVNEDAQVVVQGRLKRRSQESPLQQHHGSLPPRYVQIISTNSWSNWVFSKSPRTAKIRGA